MLTPDILRELLELLTPLATGGSGILGLHTQVVIAFGTHADLVGRITMGGNAQEYITGLLRTLDEYGETSPGTRALWQFMNHLKTQVGVDKQARIDALQAILNASPLPAIQTASSAPRVFISYARSDGEGFAHALRASLERVMIPLWQDRVGMEGGRDWWAQITAALDKVQFMVLIMTPNAMRSEVVRKEWRYARQQGACVYPVKGAPDLQFASLPKWMRDSHFYDLGFDRDHFEQGAEWGKFVVDLQSACKTPRVPFMAEDMPPDFVRRPEEFEALKGKLLGQDGTNPVAITAALKGAGGYGKTTLAKALCHDEDIQTAFDDGILWVTLGEKGDNLYEKVDGLIYALTGTKSSAPTLETATTKLVELLADRDVLLVIDDVWDQAHLRPFLQGGKGCARLITTRNSDTLPPHVQEQTVDAMKPDEASQLLAAGIPVTDPALHRALLGLARALGEWALLLKLANGVIRERIKRGETPAQALEYARRTYEKRGVLGFDGRSPSERNQAAQLSLGISFDLLHEDEKQRFAELAIFPEDLNVPLVTLERLWAAAGLDDLDTERLCETLYRYSLLLNFDLKERTARLHDVVRKYLRDTHQGEIAGWNGRFLDAYGVEAWADLPKEEPYLWDQLAYHLVEAGRAEELRAALLDFSYLQAKLNATHDPNALIGDCDFLQEDGPIQLVKSAIRLSAQWLKGDKAALAHQLVVRLTTHRKAYPVLHDLANSILAHVSGIYPASPDDDYPTHHQAGGALVRTLEHTNWTKSAAYNPDGRFIVSASADRTVQVWEAETGTLLYILQGHTDGVNSAVYSPDGRFIVSASWDNTVRVWEAETGTLLYILQGHTNCVNSAAYSPDGRFIVSASWDKTVRVWESETGTPIRTLRYSWGLNSAAYSPDRRFIVSASADRTVQVWEAETGTLLYILQGHTDGVNSAVYSPDGRFIVSASSDHTVRVWEAGTGVHLHTLKGHTDGVNSAVYSPDGRFIVSAGEYDQTVRVWETMTRVLLHAYRGHTYYVASAAFSPNGHFIVSASHDNTVRVWEVPRLTPDKFYFKVTEPLPEDNRRHVYEVSSVAYSPDGRFVVSASMDKTVRVWDTVAHTLIHNLQGHAENVNSAVYSPDGRFIISSSWDETIRVWEAETGTFLYTPQVHTKTVNSTSCSPNGRFIAFTSRDKDDNAVWVWEAPSLAPTSYPAEGQGRLFAILQGHTGRVNSAVYSPDGHFIVSASDDQTVRIWEPETGVLLHTLHGHTGIVNSALYSADGNFIVSTSRDKSENALRVWEVERGKQLAKFDNTVEGRSAFLVSFSTFTTIDAIGEIIQRNPDGQIVHIEWQGQALQVIVADHKYSFYGDAKFTCAAWSPDGRHLAAGDESGQVLFLRVVG